MNNMMQEHGQKERFLGVPRTFLGYSEHWCLEIIKWRAPGTRRKHQEREFDNIKTVIWQFIDKK